MASPLEWSRIGGFTEFVPLPCVHMEAPMYLRGLARSGPPLRQAILMHAGISARLPPLRGIEHNYAVGTQGHA